MTIALRHDSIAARDRCIHIDCLRAVAALLVIWMHVSDVFATLRPGVRSALEYIPSWLDFGRIGVLLFFLISGFLIPSSLRGDRISGAKAFAIRRFFRLYPLYWISIPPSVVTMWWLSGKDVSLRDLVLNFTMIQEKLGGVSISGLYWTLGVEICFYAICLALFVLKLLDNEKVIVFFAVGAVPVYLLSQVLTGQRVSVFGGWSLDVGFLSFMFIGTLWRRLHDGQIGRLGLYALVGMSAWFVVVFPAGALAVYVTKGTLLLDQCRFFAAYSLATLAFIAGTVLYRLTWRPLAWVGKISYSMYLLHPIIFYPIYFHLAYLPADHWLRNQYLGVYIVAIALLTIGISAVTYRLIEQPMINLGAKLTSRRPVSVHLGATAPALADNSLVNA